MSEINQGEVTGLSLDQHPNAFGETIQKVDREKIQQDIAKFNDEINSPAPDERWEGEFDLPARLIKSQVTMLLDGIGETEVFFHTGTETEGVRKYMMPRSMFEEMGRPRVVTVTVRPGNQLT